MTYRRALHTSESGLDPLAALREPITVLAGTDESAGGALQKIGLDSVFDLATSPLFAFANELSKSIDGSVESTLNSLGLVPGGLASEDAPEDLTDFARADLTSLRSLSEQEAEALKTSLHVASIADLGRWPPYHGALAILSAANGRELEEEEEEALKLVPRLGDYPTERRYYSTMLMDHVSVANPTSLAGAGAIDISPALDATFGFSAPAVGARATFEQSWFAQGVALGNLLHSVALAPGESTRIAVETWDRRDSGRGSEDISETERLTNVTTHNRAVNEVQEAVAKEVQTGFSRTHSEATTASGGVGFGLGLGPLTIGGSGSAGTTTTDANSFSTSAGSRSIGATMSQQVSDATQQAASSVRGRRASIIKEISQSEQQQVSTRILANYNHMHALTVQYYEIVELYRVVSRLHEVERCLFVPMKLTEFDEKTIEKYRGVLADAALSRRARELLATEFGMVSLTSTRSIRPFVTGIRTATPVMARVVAGGERETAVAERPIAPQTTSWSRDELRVASRLAATPLVRPGSSSILLPREASIETLTFTSGGAGPPIEAILLRLQSGNSVELTRTSLGWDVPGEVSVGDLLEIIVTTAQADQRLSGGLSFGLLYRGASFPITVPIDAPAGAPTVVAKVGDTGAGPEAVEHLRANRLHYNQAIWRSLDSATVALLLSRYEFEGMPVANLIDPRPIQVAGNYLVFRMPAFTARAGQPREAAEEGEAAETEARQNWARWLQRRGLDFGPATSSEGLIPVPTGGVFAEAVLERSNAAEKLDATRFWNWQDSPIPLQPPEIAAISMQSRAQSMDLTPGQLGQPVLNIVNPTNLPDPAGLGAAFAALQNGNMFRDMSGLAATIGLATSTAGEATSAAADSGRLAAANLAVAAQKEIEKDRIAAQVMLAMMGKPGGSGGTPKNISEMGSLLNAGEKRDKARRSSGGAAGSGASGAIGTDTSPSGGGSSGAGGGISGSQPWTGTPPGGPRDDYDLAYRRALYGEIGGPLASIIPTGGAGGAAAPSGPYFNLGAVVPGPLEWPTTDFPAPNEFANIFRDHYNERISRGFFHGATEVLGADALSIFTHREEIEGDLRNGALSIVNNRYPLINNDNGREKILYAMNCIALASSYDAAKAANPIIAGGGTAPTTSINVPFEVVYVAKRLGVAVAWYDQMIREAVTQEAARISRAKTAWETEAGIVLNILTLPVPPAFSVPVGTGLSMLVSGLSQRFDREFDKYQTVINEFKQAYGQLAKYFLTTTLKAMVPEGQLRSNVRAVISQFEANVLLGADQESKFLRGQIV